MIRSSWSNFREHSASTKQNAMNFIKEPKLLQKPSYWCRFAYNTIICNQSDFQTNTIEMFESKANAEIINILNTFLHRNVTQRTDRWTIQFKCFVNMLRNLASFTVCACVSDCNVGRSYNVIQILVFRNEFGNFG